MGENRFFSRIRKRRGMLDKVALPPKQAKIKTRGKREKKKEPKKEEIPPGYHWRKGYSRNGKWIEGGLVRNPTRKPKEIINPYPRMLTFWKDQTENIGGDAIQSAIRKNSRENMNTLRGDIRDNYETKAGEIGMARTEIAYSPGEEQAYIQRYTSEGWTLIYNDIPRYKQLLTVIATLGSFVYQPWQKQDIARMIATIASEINPTVGEKLSNDLPF